MPLESDRKDIFGNLIPSFGIEGLVDGLVSYVPGQGSAFDPEIQRQIIDATISTGLSGIPQGVINAPSAEYLLRNISIADGIQQDEINAVVGLLDNNLVTIDDVAAQTGIPAAEIQAVYNQIKGEPVVDVLNDQTNATAGLINLTIGSNQMLDPETLTAAQAAAQATAQSPQVSPEVSKAEDAAASGGGQTEEFADLGADTTANELLTGGLGDVNTGGVTDTNETWTYDKATDSFISNTRGDVFPNRGNATLRDGGIYAVTPVLGTDGVTAENVVDTETNESVGILNVDITTGLPSIIKTVDSGSSVSETDTFGTAQDTLNTGQTLGVGGGDLGGATTGDTGFETARDTNNTGKTLTVGDTKTTTTVINGKDGVDGQDGQNGQDGQDGRDGTDGKDGKDGKDGMIGLFSRVINETPLTESILFPTKFTKLENVQQGMFGEFLRAAGGRR